METDKAAGKLIKEMEKLLRRRIGPVFKTYGLDIDALLTPLKWQPLVLVIGNYSSGKSTFINELLGMPVQRTGQAPTDDCFTILTGPDGGGRTDEVPGSTVVNDERLPFESLRRFGESLMAHLRLKRVDSPILQNLAIIDTPGMLDSVTEKDRGYDYLGVVSELARLADLVILMFDPHKAGTIKETYQAIRSTLPGSTGEDRVLYVINRIDECENIPDLVRSYGTLCWNLSQMTGRKDIPRVYLTFAADEAELHSHGLEPWVSEREELKTAVANAPRMRLNHILQEVDRGVRELQLEAEALAAFKQGANDRSQNVFKFGLLAAVLFFMFGDLLARLAVGLPEKTLFETFFSGTLTLENFIGPGLLGLAVLGLTTMLVRRWVFPRFVRKTLADLDSLMPLDEAYKRDLWRRVRDRVYSRISEQGARQLWIGHRRHSRRLEKFLDKELVRLYELVSKG